MGHYAYPLTGIPGGVWNTAESPGMSDLLSDLIRDNIAALPGDTPANQLFVISGPTEEQGAISVIVDTLADLTNDEKAILDTLVPHGPDYFIVTEDGGATDLGEPSEINQDAGPSSSKTITLKWKDGAGQDSNGFGDKSVQLTPAALLPIDKTGGTFDSNGKFAFVVGASLSRGAVNITCQSDKLPVRNLLARWN